MTIVDVSSKVRRERITLCSAALADALLIALMFTVLGSKFILAPGFAVDFGGDSLPAAKSPDAAVVDGDLDVLNANGNSMVIFDGAIFNAETFARKMATEKKRRGTLLVKADKNLDAQTLLNICESARAGGYTKIHIAARPENP
ncbi:hypothetical protein P3B99_004085 [Opitutia bacterium KCR 482]|nr:hypothetical protein [Opitutae bacterium KCR 482]